MTSLLAARDLSPEELAAHDEDPRPGVWAVDRGPGRGELTQDETDAVIRAELINWAIAHAPDEVDEVIALVGGAAEPIQVHRRKPWTQRGGIDSDPLVRLLAFRVWGDRDQRWAEERGVRAGDQVSVLGWEFLKPGDRVDGRAVGRSWPGEPVLGIALSDAGPRDAVSCVMADGQTVSVRVSDRPREPVAPEGVAAPTDARAPAG